MPKNANESVAYHRCIRFTKAMRYLHTVVFMIVSISAIAQNLRPAQRYP